MPELVLRDDETDYTIMSELVYLSDHETDYTFSVYLSDDETDYIPEEVNISVGQVMPTILPDNVFFEFDTVAESWPTFYG